MIMTSYNTRTYKNIAMGVATAALTTPHLDALVVGTNFGPSGLVIPEVIGSSTPGMKFGFNLQGDYTQSKGGFKGISADHAFKAARNPDDLENEYIAVAMGINNSVKVAAFTSGPIGESTPFGTGNYGKIRGRLVSDDLAVDDTGPLAGIGRGALALKFATGNAGDYRYGWADILIDENDFIIYGFGFETAVNTAIEYGAVGTVPEVKQSALLLGLGAMGVAALRKRKRNVA